MAKIARYNGNLKAFASEQLTNERTVFGQTAIADDLTSQFTTEFWRGWGIVGPSDQPSLQDFNALGYTLSQVLAYLHQMGVPEYNAAQEYFIGSRVTVSGVEFVSMTNGNIGNNPLSSPLVWFEPGKRRSIAFLAGVTNWTVPLEMRLGLVKPRVYVTGGGGGTAGTPAVPSGSTALSPAAGAGGTAIRQVDLTGVTTVTVTVGAMGGGGGSSGTAGGNGGTSSFGSFCTASGGVGSTGITVAGTGNRSGSSGGTASGGDINIRGGDGSAVYSNGGSFTPVVNGNGGASYWGGGPNAYSNGSVYGTGGGSSESQFGDPASQGLSGAPGIIVLEY